MSQFTDESFEAIDMESVADTALEEIQAGMIVRGEVVTVDSEFAYVNVGTKSDGRIALEEFDNVPQVGDVFNVKIMNKKIIDGVYHCSRKAADYEKGWQEFLDFYNQGNRIIKGKVKSALSKGKIIDCGFINAFLPYSLTADLKALTESAEEYEFVIKSFDSKKRSVVVSRKDYLDEEGKKNWDAFAAKYKEGDVVQGEVVKFVEFGAFIRIEGIDALLHRNDMSWKKVFKQRKLLKVGETREFLILSINREAGKISLGLKQLKEDPWSLVEQKYHVNGTVKGKVVTITPVGAFVEIEEDVEGFVSNSELSWTRSNASAKDYLNKGDVADFQILSINGEDKKISLGYKQLQPNPWDTIDQRFPAGTVLTRAIKKVVKFGYFVELEDGIDGLIHVSDITWDDTVKDPVSLYKAGNEVEFIILEINKREMKVSCGIKQLSRSPWEIVKEKYPPRTRVNGVVSGITQFGVFIKIDDEVEGLVHISEVSRNRVDNLNDHFKVGQQVEAVVLDVDVNKKRLSLSIKHFEIMSEKEEVSKILKKTSPNTVTLGDMINIELGDKK